MPLGLPLGRIDLAAAAAARIASVAALAVLATISTASADSPRPACAERSKVIARLAERYGETLQSLGLQQSRGVIEVYASDATGTWTILITRPDGQACLLASGQAWESKAAPLAPPGDDA